jgi:hypothetical protein
MVPDEGQELAYDRIAGGVCRGQAGPMTDTRPSSMSVLGTPKRLSTLARALADCQRMVLIRPSRLTWTGVTQTCELMGLNRSASVCLVTKPGSTEKLLVVQCSAGRRSFDPQTFGVSRNTDSRARWVRDSCCFRVLSVASNEARPRRGRRVQVTSTIDRCRRMASSNRCAHGQRVGR